MIIVVCTDDNTLITVAKRSIKNIPKVFGMHYLVYDKKIPKLQESEDLFIIAHGAYNGDDGNPVIGDQGQDFYVNAEDLLLNINTIFPINYKGNIYIDACESADHDIDTFSFIEVVKAQINIEFKETKVFGRNGASRGLISSPDDPAWVKAILD